jgi:hypothetical protein
VGWQLKKMKNKLLKLAFLLISNDKVSSEQYLKSLKILLNKVNEINYRVDEFEDMKKVIKKI